MGVKKLLSTKSSKNKFNNLEFTIYLDIGVGLLLLLILIISLIPNSINIIPIKIVKPFLGINNLIDILKSFHYILIGITTAFIVQSITMLSEYKNRKIESNSIVKLLFYKWIIFTIMSAIPYAFNIQTPLIFIILSILIALFFWYSSLDLIENNSTS